MDQGRPHTLSCLNKETRHGKKYCISHDSADWDAYKELRNKCKTTTRNAKANYYNDCLSTDFKNSKKFWKKMNSITNKHTKSLISHIKVNNKTISEPLLIAEAFSQHFSSDGSSFSFPSYSDISFTQNRCNRSFCFNTITPLDVQQVIDGIKSGCSAGPDGLEIKFFKLASNVLSFPLADIFNLSLATCETPRSWKCAGGDITDINKTYFNY